MRERIEQRIAVARIDDDGTVETFEATHVVEREVTIPRPPRVPDMVREYAAAVVKCAPGFRAAVVNTGSTLRLVRESEAA